jgi:hypothetical protein
MTAIIRSDTFYFHLRCEAETKLSPSEEHTLEKHAKRIRETQARVRKVSAEAVMRIGEELTIARDLLAHYGNGTFGKWVVARCGISRSTAYRAIDAYYRFHDCPTVGQTFEASALYLLSSDKVPDEVIDAAIKHAKRGKLVTKKYAQRLLEQYTGAAPVAETQPAQSPPAADVPVADPPPALTLVTGDEDQPAVDPPAAPVAETPVGPPDVKGLRIFSDISFQLSNYWMDIAPKVSTIGADDATPMGKIIDAYNAMWAAYQAFQDALHREMKRAPKCDCCGGMLEPDQVDGRGRCKKCKTKVSY